MESSVDMEARRKASSILRAFLSGLITNDEFEDSRPQTDDPAVHAIWDSVWVFYSDIKRHRLVAQDRLPVETRRMCIRWLIFLDTDLPYEWPHLRLPGIDPLARAWSGSGFLPRLKDIFNIFGHSRETAAKFMIGRDYEVWPFARDSDYSFALSCPRRLIGRGRQVATYLKEL